MLQQMDLGRWNIHIGTDRGGAQVEAKQKNRGRDWGSVATTTITQLPPLGNPSIDQMNTAQDHIYGWATPGATVKVHVHGVVIRDVGVDRSR